MGAIQRVVTVVGLTSIFSVTNLPISHGQNLIGEAIGKVIVPALGPVAERAGGQVLDGLLTRRGRGQPSPQPIPPQPIYPQPRPIVRPYPQPTPVQPTPVQPTYPYHGRQPETPYQPGPVIINPGIPVNPGFPTGEISPPATAPPENRVVVSPQPPHNVNLTDRIYDHALRLSITSASEVVRHEADEIAQRIQALAINAAQANGVSPLLQSADSIIQLDHHAAHAERLDSIESFRSRLTELPADALPPDEIGFISERLRNMKNTVLLGQITRVLAVERRRDLMRQVAQAADKSDAPYELVALLTGVGAGTDWVPAPEVVLPGGTPLISIFNPLSTNAEVHFTHEEAGNASLPPGELVTAYDPFVLSFQNGNGTVKRYTISRGFYEWSLGEDGWDIRKKQTVRFILNANFAPAAFEFLLDGQPGRIEVGETREFTSDAAPRLDYRLSDGTVITNVLTPDRYLISVDPATTDWQIVRKPDIRSTHLESTKSRALAAWNVSIDRVRRGVPVGGRDPSADSSVGSLLEAIEN